MKNFVLFYRVLMNLFVQNYYKSHYMKLSSTELVAKKCAKSGKYNSIITLGAVIKGSTSHYDYVCAEVSKGVASVSLETGIPVIFGVLTTENLEQAIERAGTKSGNKGADAAKSAIEMASLLKNI